MQRVQADAEGFFAAAQVQRQGVVAGHVVAQRFAALRDHCEIARPSPSVAARSSVAVEPDRVRKTEKSAGADATVPMEITCYCDRALRAGA